MQVIDFKKHRPSSVADPFVAALQGASAGYNAGSQMLGALGGTIGE